MRGDPLPHVGARRRHDCHGIRHRRRNQVRDHPPLAAGGPPPNEPWKHETRGTVGQPGEHVIVCDCTVRVGTGRRTLFAGGRPARVACGHCRMRGGWVPVHLRRSRRSVTATHSRSGHSGPAGREPEAAQRPPRYGRVGSASAAGRCRPWCPLRTRGSGSSRRVRGPGSTGDRVACGWVSDASDWRRPRGALRGPPGCRCDRTARSSG